MFDWNDLRVFLAVARSGSTLGAARALGVNATTAARRIAELERALGLRLFDRRQSGYALTEAGQALRGAAERVEREATAFADGAAAFGRSVAGVIRVTTNEGLANGIMAPALSRFRQLYPEIRFELIVEERRLDIGRGAADVALRTGARPNEPGLAGRRLTPLAWAVYCGKGYADPPAEVAALAGHPVIGAEAPIAELPGWVWLKSVVPPANVVARSSSVTNLIAAVRSGLGLSVLPCLLADTDPGLARCLGPIDGIESELWLVTRDELRDVPRIRSFLDFLAAHVMAMRPLMSGAIGSAQAVVRDHPPDG